MMDSSTSYMHHWYVQTHQGQNHQKWGTPCQDAAYGFSENNASSVILADGLGSAKHSHLGANHVVKDVAHHLVAYADDVMAMDKATFCDMISQTVTQSLNDLSHTLKVDIADLSSTLMGVFVKDGHYILFHLGDGATGYQDNALDVHLMSRDSEHSSEVTDCTTTRHLNQLIKVYKGSMETIRGFILMTDGLEDVFLIKKKTPPTFANGVRKLFDWHQTLEPSRLKEGLEREFEGSIATVTMDDLGLALFSVLEKQPSFLTLSYEAQKKVLSTEYSSQKAQIKNIEFTKHLLGSVHTPMSRRYLVKLMRSSYGRVNRILNVLKKTEDIVEADRKIALR